MRRRSECQNGEKELYDLASDPNELTNVAGQATYATRQAQLAARLAQLKTQ